MNYILVTGQNCVTSYIGPLATRLFQARVMRSGLSLHVKTKGVLRHSRYSPTKILEFAGAITGKTYGPRQYQQAIADLDSWIAKTSSTIPVIRRP